MHPDLARRSIELSSALLNVLDTNERLNQFLLQRIPAAAWRADPPGGRGRTVASIFAHMHNVRHLWLTVSGRGVAIPPKVERSIVTRAQIARSLAKSHRALRALVEPPLQTDLQIAEFRPDVVGFIGYILAHEAHHRGQITMLARQTGYPLSMEAQYGLWEWARRAKEAESPGAAVPREVPRPAPKPAMPKRKKKSPARKVRPKTKRKAARKRPARKAARRPSKRPARRKRGK